MNSMTDFEYSYQGITFDERMAIRHLFSNEDDTCTIAEQPPTGSLVEGPLQ